MKPVTRADVETLLPLVLVDAVFLAGVLHAHPTTVRRWIRREGLEVVDAGTTTPAVRVADVLVALGLDPVTGEPPTPAPVQLTLIEPTPIRRRKAAGS